MPSLTPEQLAERDGGLGASEAAMVLGLSPFGGDAVVQARKLAGGEDEPTIAKTLGHLLEPVVADLVRQRKGWALRAFHRTIWHPAGLPMFCTPDYDIVGLPEGLEIKTSAGRGEEWGEDGDPAGVPVHVQVQVQHQMACRPSWRRVWVAVLLWGRDLRMYPVDRNPGRIALLEEALPAWWQRHVVERQPIDPDGSDGSAAALQALYPAPVEDARPATEEEELLALEVLEAQAAKAEAEARHELARQRLFAAIGPAAAVAGTTWKATLALQRGRVDWKAAAIAAGVTEEAAEGFRGQASRVLRVSSTAKERAA